MDKQQRLRDMFEQGFIEKCAEAGLEKEAVLKQVGRWLRRGGAAAQGKIGRAFGGAADQGAEGWAKRWATQGDTAYKTLTGVPGASMNDTYMHMTSPDFIAKANRMKPGTAGAYAKNKLGGYGAEALDNKDLAYGIGGLGGLGALGAGAYGVMGGGDDEQQDYGIPPEMLMMMMQGQQQPYYNPYTQGGYGYGYDQSRYNPYNWAM